MKKDKPAPHTSDRKSPGFWFYPDDWESDVQILSLSAQGLWMRMLCKMHANEMHRGFLEFSNGAPYTDSDIAKLVGKNLNHVKKCLADLRRVGTCSVTEVGCYFNRRMAREEHISCIRRGAAMRRLNLVNRAKDGTFAGEIHPAKTEQKPEVTAPAPAPAPAPVSSYTSTRASAAAAKDSGVVLNSPKNAAAAVSTTSKFPLTTAALRELFEGSGDSRFVGRLVKQVQSRNGNKKASDELIAEAIRACHKPNTQESAGLFLETVPQCVHNWLVHGRKAVTPPTKKSSGSDRMREALELERAIDRRMQKP